MRIKRLIGFVVAVAVVWLLALVPVFAQCPMCRASIAGSENPGELSRVVDTAVLVLLIPTMVIIGAIVSMVLRFRHSQGGESCQGVAEVGLAGRPENPDEDQEAFSPDFDGESRGEWSAGAI